MKSGSGSVLKNDTDVKIFILFLLNHVRCPLTLDELTDLVTGDGLVDGFDFTGCFSELIEHGHVIEAEEDGERLYAISEKGMETSANLEDSLLSSLRKRSLQTATRYLSLRRRSATVTAEVTPGKTGVYTVTCRAATGGNELASFSLSVASAEVAEQIRSYFLEKPEIVIRGLTAAATGELGYLLYSFSDDV